MRLLLGNQLVELDLMHVGIDRLHLANALSHHLPLIVLLLSLRLVSRLLVHLQHLTLLFKGVLVLSRHWHLGHAAERTLHLTLEAWSGLLLISLCSDCLLLRLLKLLLLHRHGLPIQPSHVELLLLLIRFLLILSSHLSILLCSILSQSLRLLHKIRLLLLTLILRAWLDHVLLVGLRWLDKGLLLITISLHLQNLSQSLLFLRALTLNIGRLLLQSLLLLLALYSMSSCVESISHHLLRLWRLLLLLLLLHEQLSLPLGALRLLAQVKEHVLLLVWILSTSDHLLSCIAIFCALLDARHV